MLFQEHNLFNHLNVFQNIGLGINPALKLNKTDHQSIDEAMNKVDLEGMAKRQPESLSGGQRQRVAIARCLVRSRPMLLLDEPFGGLNKELKTEIKLILKQLCQEQRITMLWVTHDSFDVEEIANLWMKIDDGQIVSLTQGSTPVI